MSPEEIELARRANFARYAGMTDWEVERLEYRLGEVTAEALRDELISRGWTIKLVLKEEQ